MSWQTRLPRYRAATLLHETKFDHESTPTVCLKSQAMEYTKINSSTNQNPNLTKPKSQYFQDSTAFGKQKTES